MCRRGFQCLRERRSLDALQTTAEKVVGSRFDPLGYMRIGRSPVRRIVLEATVVRRIVRWRDYDPIGDAPLSSAVVTHNQMGHGPSGRVSRPFRKHYINMGLRGELP